MATIVLKLLRLQHTRWTMQKPPSRLSLCIGSNVFIHTGSACTVCLQLHGHARVQDSRRESSCMTTSISDATEIAPPDQQDSDSGAEHPVPKRQPGEHCCESRVEEVALCFYAILDCPDLEDAFSEFVVPDAAPPYLKPPPGR